MNGEENFGELPLGPCVGAQLKAARETQGLELEEVASSTRIPLRHLRTIERCEYDGLPAATYSTGFIKSWARLLGMNGQALADAFRIEIGGVEVESAQPLPYEPADPRRTPPAGLAFAALLVAVALILGYLYWRGSTEQAAVMATTEPRSAVAPPVAPAPVAVPAAGPLVVPVDAASMSGPVVITATDDVWIKVSDSGKTLFMNVLHPGDRFEVPADAAAAVMTTGRPGFTKVMVGTTAIPTVGDPDRAAKDVSLKPADLLARVSAAGSGASPADQAPPVDNGIGG